MGQVVLTPVRRSSCTKYSDCTGKSAFSLRADWSGSSWKKEILTQKEKPTRTEEFSCEGPAVITWPKCLTLQGGTKAEKTFYSGHCPKCPLSTDSPGALPTSSLGRVSVFSHLLAEKCFLKPHLNPAGWLWTIPTCPDTGCQGEELSTSSSISAPQEAPGTMSPSPLGPFLLIRQTQSPQIFPTEYSSQNIPASLDPLLWIMSSQILFCVTSRAGKVCVQ